MSDLIKPISSAPYLLSRISDKSIPPEKLTRHQRRICVRYLLGEQKHTQRQIGDILHVTEQAVSVIKRKIMRDNAYMVDEIDERQEAVRIMQTADLAVSSLFRAGLIKDAWTVRREAITVLQSLGYLKRAPIEFKGEVTLQEIVKLANSPDEEDETFLGERSGQGRKNFITNGTS